MGMGRSGVGLPILCLVACASIPKGQYGVRELALEGVDRFDEHALRACLVTHERDRFAIAAGSTTDLTCGTPPFRSSRLRLSLWSWPWSEWPAFDPGNFERDLKRVERWYRARGYYDARVVHRSANRKGAIGAETAQLCKGDDCELRLRITVDEGEPTRVTAVNLSGASGLPRPLRERLRDALRTETGGIFDEHTYDRDRTKLETLLEDAGYAYAIVTGKVKLDPAQRAADVTFEVNPGPLCFFGEVTVQTSAKGAWGVPKSTVVAASGLKRGMRFSRQLIQEAQRAVYALGAFVAVEVDPQLPEGKRSRHIDVVIRVETGRLFRFGVGAGIQAGTFEFLDGDTDPVPQWDLHLLGMVEHRNFFGGLRRLRIEERPRLIFQNQNPLSNIDDPRLGNEVRLEFRQPAFFEPRTTLVVGARWDLGPNPFKGFFRHDISAQVGPERSFFDGRLFVALRLRENILVPLERGPDVPSDYQVMFLEQFVRLDLRDQPRYPTAGGYFSASVHQAGYVLPSSWNYVRVTPEVRGYAPLPLGFVVAARVAAGALFVTRASDSLDADSARFGPERFRLRGGGASSNRGYLPGDLGDSVEGGIRRWEAAVELRVPFTQSFGAVLFSDAADVHAGDTFRLDRPHLSVGAGLRYRTIVGPLRFDVGYQVPGAQALGQPDRVAFENTVRRTEANLGLFRFPGAIHLTIGEAF